MHSLFIYQKGKTMNAKISILNLTGKERKLLKKIYKKGIGRVSYRAQIILLSTSLTASYTRNQIAAQCFCCRKTVYNTICKYKENGIWGIFDLQKPGRPCLINAKCSQEIQTTIQTSKPSKLGKHYFHSSWTLKIIRDYLAKSFSIFTSQRTISRWLHSNGWSYHRSKKELFPIQPLLDKEQRAVMKLLRNLNRNQEVLLFVDQSAFYLDGLPGGCWSPCGEQHQIQASGSRQKRWLFGAFNPHDGKFYYRMCKKCNSEEMILFLHQIRQRFRNKSIHIVLDNARFHTSAETEYFLQNHDEFVLHFLPPRGAKLNPIERFWLFVKHITVKNSVFESLDELSSTLRKFFWHYNNGNIQYNFDIQKTINVWNQWPCVSVT